MVRLKATVNIYWSTTSATTFQFQYGAIKGSTAVYSGLFGRKFQFQYGAIKGCVQVQRGTDLCNGFNSSMVRLKDR